MALSSDHTMTAGAAPAAAAQQGATGARYLYGPVTDFLCLGGISFLLLPVIFMLPEENLTLAIGAMALALANVINHPHFAFSYQIFYDGFRHKAFGADVDASLRARYIFAGIVVPLALAVFFATTMIYGNARVLGFAGNLMAFLVGWHYAKQGYGMLMVDAALKRRFFNDTEKKILRVNAYAVWALSWMMANTIISERAMWGIQYYMFHIPSPVLAAGICVAVATTVMTISVLIGKWRANGGDLPVNGVAAYAASLYLWLLLMHWNALWLFVVPALHSLQYLIVVARYRTNRYRGDADGEEATEFALFERIFRRRYQWRWALFVTLGLLLGYIGFWSAPNMMQAIVPYDRAEFGPTVFLFVFWMFINVHHYYLDNVMWRRENPDMRRYLFA